MHNKIIYNAKNKLTHKKEVVKIYYLNNYKYLY